MRLALVIVSLAFIAVGLVHIRRCEIATRAEMQRIRTYEVTIRRRLWDQQVQLGYLTAPGRLLHRSEEMALPLADRNSYPRWPLVGQAAAQR